jgi:hypothetical protein
MDFPMTLAVSKSLRALCLILALAPAVSGCAIFDRRWPEAGGGGYGEYQELTDPRAMALDERLSGLVARGAQRFAAAELDEASLLFIRIKRELAADHPEDAQLNMDRLDALADRMEKRLIKARK